MKPHALVYMRVPEEKSNNPKAFKMSERLLNEQFTACLDELDRQSAHVVEFFIDFEDSDDLVDRSGLADLLNRADSPFRDIDLVVAITPAVIATDPRKLAEYDHLIRKCDAELIFVSEHSEVRAA